MRYRPFGAAAALLGAVILVGCSSPEQGNVVKGKVIYKNAPLPTGTVSFFNEKGQLAGSGSVTDGVFRVEKLPTGPLKIAVVTPPAAAKAPPAPKGAPLAGPQIKVVPVPAKYHSPAKSGLTYTVTAGEQIHDFELK